MTIIFFVSAGLIALWVIVQMLRLMGIREFVTGCLFVCALVVLVCGVLRAASNKAGGAEESLPGPWGDIERVFR